MDKQTMDFFVNDSPRQGLAGLSLEGLLLAEGLGRGEPPQIPAGVAVALNQVVIPRPQWALTPVASGDRIDIFSVIAGG
ncbi:sulfur carrier protein ThiS [Pseudaeromonas sp. ZJS20]|uniref:sulfur carrier protein ThiS n=1 Tax=Pseudaeromonas aegiceratis TaxID=3153928 RepID=UPI00390C9583